MGRVFSFSYSSTACFAVRGCGALPGCWVISPSDSVSKARATKALVDASDPSPQDQGNSWDKSAHNEYFSSCTCVCVKLILSNNKTDKHDKIRRRGATRSLMSTTLENNPSGITFFFAFLFLLVWVLKNRVNSDELTFATRYRLNQLERLET